MKVIQCIHWHQCDADFQACGSCLGAYCLHFVGKEFNYLLKADGPMENFKQGFNPLLALTGKDGVSKSGEGSTGLSCLLTHLTDLMK